MGQGNPTPAEVSVTVNGNYQLPGSMNGYTANIFVYNKTGSWPSGVGVQVYASYDGVHWVPTNWVTASPLVQSINLNPGVQLMAVVTGGTGTFNAITVAYV